MSGLTSVHTLSLYNTGLTSLPKDMSCLKFVTKLNLMGNSFYNISLTIGSLKTLPNLKDLSINIKTKEEAQFILNSLLDLEILNDERIDESYQEDITIK